MGRIVYVNGNYVPEETATISIFDRGFLMADGVYEVTTVLDSKLLDFDGHLNRLKRSLAELGMSEPEGMKDLLEIHRELININKIKPRTANHSSQSLGKESTKFCLTSHVFKILLFDVKVFINSLDL